MEAVNSALKAPPTLEPRERPGSRRTASSADAAEAAGVEPRRGTEPAEKDSGSQVTDMEKLTGMLDEISQELIEHGSYRLDMSYDDEVSRFVVALVDDQTGDTLRQFPPEQLLAAGKNLMELRGLLFDDKS